MNFRKFYLIISTILVTCLFVTGTYLLAGSNLPQGDSDGIMSGLLNSFKLGNEPVNILVLGGDQVASNTDTMMLVNYNPVSSKASIMSIPRDTKVNVPGSGVPKINSAYSAGGGKLAAEIAGKLLNVKIKYYVFINTAAFRNIIDALGGVKYTIPADMNYDDPTQNLHIHLEKGPQTLNGEKAEHFMRFRQPNSYTGEITQYYDGSDLKRIEAQQSFLKELIKQKASLRYISKVDDIINIMFKNITTNMSSGEAVKMAESLIRLKVNEINTYTLPGVPQEGGGWYYIMDKAKTKEITDKYFFSNAGFSTRNASAGKDIKGSSPDVNKTKEKTVPVSPAPSKMPGTAAPSPTPESVIENNPSNPGGGINDDTVGAGP